MEAAMCGDVMGVLLDRSSLRQFADREIEREVMDEILEAGVRSASGGNLQPWSTILIRDPEARNRLAEMCTQEFMAKAPVHLLFCLDMHRDEIIAKAGAAPYAATSAFRHFWISFQDVVIAAQSMCTAADMTGLGSVYIGTVMEFGAETRAMFGLPDGVYPVVLVCMGYPAEDAERKPARKFPRHYLVHEEKYAEPDPTALWNDYLEREGNSLTPINERTEGIFRASCSVTVDDGFAEECMERARAQGGFNPAQRRFGIHYPACAMPCNNLDMIEVMRKAGLRFFERWEKEEKALAVLGERE
jgi:nitroreductase